MAPPTYAQNKKHIYLWVEKNYDRHKEIAAKSMRKQYQWKKIQKVFLAILL